MIQVKVSLKGAGNDIDISQFTGNPDGIVGNCQFHVNNGIKDADVWFVMEEPEPNDQECAVPVGRLIHLAVEVARPVGYADETPGMQDYLEQFDVVYTFLDRVASSTHYAIPFLPWMINANHGPSIFQAHTRDINYFRSLISVPKTREISVFCSNQQGTADHRMRLRFVKALEGHFGGHIDWFGNGFRSIPQKWDGLAPYKYTLVLENQSSNHVITEKIQDAFLALCFPIYWGAPDINSFFPHESLLAIDAKDLKGSIAAIEELLDTDPYECRLDSLIEAKRRVLDEHNVFVRMADIAEEIVSNTPGTSRSKPSYIKTVFEMRSKNISDRLSRSVMRASRVSNRFGQRLAKSVDSPADHQII